MLAACSLAVDFPEQSDDNAVDDDNGDDDDRPDASVMDGGDEEDSSMRSDARADAMRPDTGSGGECQANSGCDSDELCCDRKDGKGGVCVESTKDECSVCGEGCMTASAPNCSNRKCECRAGTGQPCPNGQTCLGTGSSARCVECTQNSDCSGTRPLCVDNECVQCSRGEDTGSAADDEGCSGSTPICGSNNTCTACSSSPNNCPSGQQCVGGVGCTGCSPTAPIGSNGCTQRTAPICRASGSMFQCGKCERNADCPGAFCDTVTGACVNECAPQAPVGSNGCSGGTPFCKAVGSDYECRPCSATDCMTGRFCATGDHPQAGNCVQCRANADCPMSAPMCNRTTGMCTACAAPRPFFDNATGQCVACATDDHCSTSTAGKYCHPSRKECVPCGMLPMPNNACATRNPSTPMCGAGGTCVGCSDDDDCSATANTPLCISGTCSACTAAGGNMGDMRCSRIGNNEVCLASGACARCDPTDDDGCMGTTPVCAAATGGNRCVACVRATDEGCMAPTPQCIPNGGADVCAACDPNGTPSGCQAGQICVQAGAVATCMDLDPGDGGI